MNSNEFHSACATLAEYLAQAPDEAASLTVIEDLRAAIAEGQARYRAKFPAPIGRVCCKSSPTRDDPFGQGEWHDFSSMTISPGRVEITSMGEAKEIPIDAGVVSFHLFKPK